MFHVTVLGTSSAVPAYGRYPTCQVLAHNERMFLLDCGEGAQFQLQRYRIRLRNLDAIFITHLHGDHVYGLPGLLTSLSIYQREAPLALIGPAGIREFLYGQFKLSDTYLNYELQITELDVYEPPLPVYENQWLHVTAFPLAHRIPCNGYRFQEKPRLPRFLGEKAHADNIPREYFHLLKQGNTVTLPDGRSIAPEAYTAAPEASRSYAFCTDTAYRPSLVPFIHDSTVLYHESTFLHDRKARADETGHSTAREAAEIAYAANAGHLLLGHYSARYHDLQPLLDEARSVFPRATLAREGERYIIGNDLTGSDIASPDTSSDILDANR